MIHSITLHNFQVHEKLRVDLDPHVTTIVGPTDAGKSAVLRGLRWVALNTPTGDSFIRHGSNCARVVLRVGKRTVVRKRGHKVNLYKLDGKPFEAFKSDVPEEIAQVLKMGDVTFQRQHDSPYWFSESAGSVSRRLNSIVNLGIIDTTLSSLASSLRKAHTEVEVVEERLKEARVQKANNKRALAMDASLRVVEGLETEVGKTASRIASLDHLLTTLDNLQQIVKRPIPNLGNLETLQKDWVKDKTRVDSLQVLLNKLERTEQLRCQLQEQHDEAQKTLARQMGKVCPLCKQRIKS